MQYPYISPPLRLHSRPPPHHHHQQFSHLSWNLGPAQSLSIQTPCPHYKVSGQGRNRDRGSPVARCPLISPKAAASRLLLVAYRKQSMWKIFCVCVMAVFCKGCWSGLILKWGAEGYEAQWKAASVCWAIVLWRIGASEALWGEVKSGWSI